MLTRRSALSGALALAATGAARGETVLPRDGAPRVAALDWTLASACLSLGLAPAGVAETGQYARWVVEPALPPGTVELGLREAPSLEGLALLAPDLILANGFHEGLKPQLERIAPTLSLDIYGDARRPLALAEGALRALARRLGRDAQAEGALLAAEAGFAGVRARLGTVPHPPLLVFNAADARNIWVYGRGSLFADALERVGLDSAWAGPTSPWGSAGADVSALAGVPEATLVLVGPVSADTEAGLAGSALWAGLTAGRTLLRLPAAWPFGETAAALRFADLVAAALAAAPPRGI